MVKIAPSLLSADFGNLKEETVCIESAGADYFLVAVDKEGKIYTLMVGSQ